MDLKSLVFSGRSVLSHWVSPVINPAHSRLRHRCFLVFSMFAVVKGLWWELSSIRLVLLKYGPLSEPRLIQEKESYYPLRRLPLFHFTSIRIWSPCDFLHSVCQTNSRAAGCWTGSEFKSLMSCQGHTSPQSQRAVGYMLGWILMEMLLTRQHSRDVCSVFHVYEWNGEMFFNVIDVYACGILGVWSDLDTPIHALSSYFVWLLFTWYSKIFFTSVKQLIWM